MSPATNSSGNFAEWSVDGAPADSREISAAAPLASAGAADLPTYAPEDFNGDGSSDALFINGDEALATWEINRTSIVGGGDIGAPGAAESVVGVGDTVGEGYASIFFSNAQTGRDRDLADVRNHDPGDLLSSARRAATGASSEPATSTATGQADLIFREASGEIAIWELDDHTIIGGGNIGNPGEDWTFVGTGDFNGDGKTDLLFENSSGAYATWILDGTSIIGGATLGTPGAGWVLKGIGDFTGDGTSDLLFYNVNDDDYATWDIQNDAHVGGGFVGAASPDFVVKGIGDYNGDGHDGVLFQNVVTGEYWTWDLDDTAIVGGADFGAAGAAMECAGGHQRLPPRIARARLLRECERRR